MVYDYVCQKWQRAGVVWDSTNLDSDTDHDTQVSWAPQQGVRKPSSVHRCALLYTCRQVHWEFVPKLCAHPLQFSNVLPGSYTIPIAPAYAKFVRKILVVHDDSDQPSYSRENADHIYVWRQLVKTAQQLTKIFRKVETVRILSRKICYEDKTFWQLVEGSPDWFDERQRQVEMAETFTRSVRWENGKKMKIPAQLEMVHVKSMNSNMIRSIFTPFGEAVRRLQGWRGTH